jgi:glycine/D-amino acid oxidase-like deaminating enzyme
VNEDLLQEILRYFIVQSSTVITMIQLPEVEKSLWREASPGQIYPALSGEVDVDVVIIGAGITGLSSAYMLKKAGLTVSVLEKDTVGGGTTGRTTGKVTSQHGLVYSELQKTIGIANTQNYADANQAAVEGIKQIVEAEKISCDFERADNYVFTDNDQEITQFKNEAKVAAKFGLPAEFLTETPLPFKVRGAVKFTDQAKMTAQKYVSGLANIVNGDGSFVFEGSNVTRIKDGQPCRISTDKGTVIAKDCIVATNVPTLPLMARGGYCILEFPVESHLIAAPYNEDLTGMYISPDKKQYSILPVTFESQKYLLIGGGGHFSTVRISKKLRYKRIADYAKRQFGIQNITHKWSDRDYIAYDKVPLVGKLYPWSKHVYVGTAFKKWGLTNGTVAAMILTDLITGKENLWAETLTPQRARPIKYIPKNVIDQAKQIW